MGHDHMANSLYRRGCAAGCAPLTGHCTLARRTLSDSCVAFWCDARKKSRSNPGSNPVQNKSIFVHVHAMHFADIGRFAFEAVFSTVWYSGAHSTHRRRHAHDGRRKDAQVPYQVLSSEYTRTIVSNDHMPVYHRPIVHIPSQNIIAAHTRTRHTPHGHTRPILFTAR